MNSLLIQMVFMLFLQFFLTLTFLSLSCGVLVELFVLFSDALSVNVLQVMKKSVIGPDFEKKDAVPPYSETKRALKLKRRVSLERLIFK